MKLGIPPQSFPHPDFAWPGKQPQCLVRVRKDTPLTKGLRHLWTMNQGGLWVPDLAGNRPAAFAGTTLPTRVDGANGRGIRIAADGTNSRLDLGSVASTDAISGVPTGEISVVALVLLDSVAERTNDYGRIIDKSTGGSAQNGWSIFVQNVSGVDTLYFQANNGATSVAWTTPPSAIRGGYRVIGVSAKSGAQIGMVDGLRALPDAEGEAKEITWRTTATNCAIGNWNHTTDRQLCGNVLALGVWDRFLWEGEHARIATDFYRSLLEPLAWMPQPFVAESAPPVGLPAYIGSTQITAGYLGATELSAIYKGASQLWP